MDPETLHATSALTCRHLSVDQSLIPSEHNSIDDLVKAITPAVANLLDRDMQGLLNALYRIDVDEDKFKKILSTEVPEKIAYSLSKLIIERELQKIITRKKYKPDR